MLRQIRWYLNVLSCGLEIGIPAIFCRAKAFPRFYRDLQEFKKQTDWPIQVEPRLGDMQAQAGSLGEYFWQDLFVARRVIELAPERHIDVGSRIDGFIGHLACVRQIEVLDIRPLSETIPGVSFHQVDITSPPPEWIGVADCITCLHSIEHFGLGRYGDRLQAEGWKSGLVSLAGLVCPEGRLILSTPVGSQRVKFNSHRIFAPGTVADFAESIGLRLVGFAYHAHQYAPESPIVISHNFAEDFSRLASTKYNLGIFEFEKIV